MQRCLADSAADLGILEQRLAMLDAADEEAGQPGQDRLRRLPGAGQSELYETENNNGTQHAGADGSERESQDAPWVLPGRNVKRRLIGEIAQVLKQYYSLMLADRDIREMPLISSVEAGDFLAFTEQKCELGDDALAMMDHKYDYVTTRKEGWHHRIERYIYSQHLRRSFWSRLMFLSHKPNDSMVRINPMIPRRIVKTAIIFTSASSVLVPIGILYLVPMSNPTSFGVVVIAVLAFSACIALLNEISLFVSLIGICTYIAVLVTFLAQFSA